MAKKPDVSPSGYWSVVLNRDVPDAPGGPYQRGGTYQVADAVLEDLDDAVASKSPVTLPNMDPESAS
jgi:hypothetical protein